MGRKSHLGATPKCGPNLASVHLVEAIAIAVVEDGAVIVEATKTGAIATMVQGTKDTNLNNLIRNKADTTGTIKTNTNPNSHNNNNRALLQVHQRKEQRARKTTLPNGPLTTLHKLPMLTPMQLPLTLVVPLQEQHQEEVRTAQRWITPKNGRNTIVCKPPLSHRKVARRRQRMALVKGRNCFANSNGSSGSSSFTILFLLVRSISKSRRRSVRLVRNLLAILTPFPSVVLLYLNFAGLLRSIVHRVMSLIRGPPVP